MNGGPSIIGIRASDEAYEASEPAADAEIAYAPVADWEDVGGGWRTVAAALLIAFALLWIGGAVWTGWQAGRAIPAMMLPLLIAAGAIGPLLAGVGWLLTQRTSTAEAQRFGRTAAAMRGEARALEQSVAVLGEAIAQHRAGLAEQLRSLTQLGDAATARLGEIGRGLSEEIDQADVHARALTSAAEAAHDRLGALLATLPRAEEETRALTSAIDAATLRTAEGAVALDAQIAAVTARGREAEQVAGSAAEKLAAHIQRMEATSDAAGARLEAVTSSAAGAIDALLYRTAVAIDESRKGIAAQGDAMLAMVTANQHALDCAAHESAEALAERISIIEQVIERIALTLDRQRGVGDALLGGLDSGIATADARLAALHASGVERTQHLAGSISALAGSAEAMTAALGAGDLAAKGAIVTTERLLTAFDAAAREMDETLPDALARLDTRVAASQRVVAAAKPELLALVTAAESTHDAIEAIAGVVAEQRRNVDTLTATLLEALTSGRGQADEIGAQLDEATTRAHRFAEDAAPRLLEALLRVRETATAAADHARETLARVIPEAASALERQSAAALERVTQTGVETQIALIADLAQTAVKAADAAGARLEDRLHAIDTAAASIDDRLTDARAAQDERDGDSFARRASLLIEALNSASIDLTRSLAPDVADSAWAAYLKGDRGVFTRRAVRLLDSGAQRDLARLYDDDDAFRDQVNRYIHDFEAMLRTILAQRDGSPLGVTLLSSDMGKLYVALAQAIERLR